MQLTHIHIDNFFSFGLGVEVNFTDYGNLILVKGEIADTENSNGAGKSSLFEAFYWCLTGKTVRNVKAGDVVKMGEKYAQVTATFNHQAKEFKVTRMWQADKKEVVIVVDGKEERFHDMKQATHRVFELLSVTPNILSLIGFYGRKFHTFSDLTPKERAELIDVLAQGQRWEDARERARDSKKTSQVQYDTAQEQREGIISQTASLENDLKECVAELEDVKQKHAQAKQVLQEKLTQAKATRDACQIEITNSQPLMANIPTVEAEIKTLQDDFPNIKHRLESTYKENFSALHNAKVDCDNAIGVRQTQLAELQSQIQGIEKEANHIRGQKGATNCHACGQALPNPPDNDTLEAQAVSKLAEIEPIKAKLQEANEQKTALEGSIKQAEAEESQLRASIDSQYQDEIKNANALINQKQQAIAQVKDNANKLQMELERANSSVDQAENQLRIADAAPEILKLETAIEEKTKHLQPLKEQVIQIDRNVKEHAKTIQIATFWEKAFKDLRFSVFDNTIHVLQDLLNAFCSSQGLDFDRIEVTSYKENSSGKVVPEVNIYVVRKGDRMSVDQLSEGETQRVDLACFFTFSILIEKSIGFDIAFNILDEPLTGLDEEGRKRVFDILCDLSKDKQLFVIDHDANFQDLFSDVIVVRKENNQSTIQRESKNGYVGN